MQLLLNSKLSGCNFLLQDLNVQSIYYCITKKIGWCFVLKDKVRNFLWQIL